MCHEYLHSSKTCICKFCVSKEPFAVTSLTAEASSATELRVSWQPSSAVMPIGTNMLGPIGPLRQPMEKNTGHLWYHNWLISRKDTHSMLQQSVVTNLVQLNQLASPCVGIIFISCKLTACFGATANCGITTPFWFACDILWKVCLGKVYIMTQ